MFINYVIVTCFVTSCMGLVPETQKPYRSYTSKDEVVSHVVVPGSIRKGEIPYTSVVEAGGKILFMIREKLYELVRRPEDSSYYKEVLTWESDAATRKTCTAGGFPETICHNFITSVFFTGNSKFTICGTNSCSPACRNYTVENGKFKFSKDFSGSDIVPCRPTYTLSSYYEDGVIYSGTMSDVRGTKPLINRYSIDSDKASVHTIESNERWLKDPNFVRFVSDNEGKVYSLFKETSIEDRTGALEWTYSRVAQTCMSDEGGQSLLKNRFTSYQKARLVCSVPGSPPFEFNELQAATDFVTLKGRNKVLFAIMSTPSNSIPGSAICAYSLNDIEEVMTGDVLDERVNQADNFKYWSSVPLPPNLKQYLTSCRARDDTGSSRQLSPEELNFMKHHPLKASGVQSWSEMKTGTSPLFVGLGTLSDFSAITVDDAIEATDQFVVLFIGTSDGRILKIAALSKNGRYLFDTDKDTVLIEERMAFDVEKCGETNRTVRNIMIDKTTNDNLIVNFDGCSVILPLCPLKTHCKKTCLAAQDPYCIWKSQSCASTTKRRVGERIENPDSLPDCPISVIDDGSDASLKNSMTAPPNNSIETATTQPLDPAGIPVEKAGLTSGQDDISLGVAIGMLFAGIVFGVVLTILTLRFCYRRKESPKQLQINGNANQNNNNKTEKSKSRTTSESSVNRKRTTSERSSNSRGDHETDNLINPDGSKGDNPRRSSSDAKKMPRQSSSSNRTKRTSKPSIGSFEDPSPVEYQRSLSAESHPDSTGEPENERLNKSLPSSGFKRSSIDESSQRQQKARNPVSRHLSLQMPQHQMQHQGAHPDTPMPQFTQQAPTMRHQNRPMGHSKSFPGNTQSLDRRTERSRKNNVPSNLADVTEEAESINPYTPNRKRFQSESATNPHAIRPSLSAMPKHSSIDEEEPPEINGIPHNRNPADLHSNQRGKRMPPRDLPLAPQYNAYPYQHQPGIMTGPAQIMASPMQRGIILGSPAGEMAPYGFPVPPYQHNTMSRLPRQNSEMLPPGHYPPHRHPYNTMGKPPLTTQQSMFEPTQLKNGRPPIHPQSRSNPGTPDDPNPPPMLTNEPPNERKRHPSGRSQGVASSPSKPNPPLFLKQDSGGERSRHLSGPAIPNGGGKVMRKSPGESPMKAPFSVAPANVKPTEEMHSTL